MTYICKEKLGIDISYKSCIKDKNELLNTLNI